MSLDEKKQAVDWDNPPSVLVLPATNTAAEIIERSLRDHDVEVTVESDVLKGLDNPAVENIECVLVQGNQSITRKELLGRVRDREPDIPVIFLPPHPSDELPKRFAHSETIEHVEGSIESISYKKVADRIRTAVKKYRDPQANTPERDQQNRRGKGVIQPEQRLTTLHSVAKRFREIETADGVYEGIVDAAVDILNFELCTVFEVNDDYLVPRAQYSANSNTDLSWKPLDSGLVGKAYATGNPIHTDEIDRWEGETTSENYQSVITLPIGEFGVFQALSEKTEAFDQNTLEVMGLLTELSLSVLERLSYQEQLRVERDRYAALYKNSSDSIIEAEFVGKQAIIRRVNPAFESDFGYAESDVVGRAVDDVIVTEDRREEAHDLTMAIREGNFVQKEVRRKTTDGLKDFLLQSVPVDDDSLFAIYTDITERKEYERALERQREELEVLNRLLQHDINNDMEVVLRYNEMVKREINEPQLVERLSKIEYAAKNVVDLTKTAQDLMQLMVTESRETKPVQLATVLESVMDEANTIYEDASVEFAKDCDFEGVEVIADELLESVFRNLVKNAIKHNDKDSPEVTFDSEDGDDQVRVTIADNGPGLPEEQKQSLFENDRDSTQGSGIGLFLVTELVDTYNGEIWVEDNDPCGTVVTVQLKKA